MLFASAGLWRHARAEQLLLSTSSSKQAFGDMFDPRDLHAQRRYVWAIWVEVTAFPTGEETGPEVTTAQ